jgi:hypothetical protein
MNRGECLLASFLLNVGLFILFSDRDNYLRNLWGCNVIYWALFVVIGATSN